LQKLVPGFGSSVSLRRPVWCWVTCYLAQARMACLSEVAMRHVLFCVESSFGRRVVCLSEGESRWGEKDSPERETMVSHYFTLAQARWFSLSKTNVLAWVKFHGLSENGKKSGLCALFELVCLLFPKLRKLYAYVCDVCDFLKPIIKFSCNLTYRILLFWTFKL